MTDVLTIRISEDITPEGWGGITANSVIALMENTSSAGRLEVYFNSRGGSIFEGAAIADAIARYPAKEKVGIVSGICYSAATFAFAQCDIRLGNPLSVIGVHRGSALASGYATDLRFVADQLDQFDTMVCDFYAQRLGKTKQEIWAWMIANSGNGTMYTAKEAYTQGWYTEDPIPAGPEVENHEPATKWAQLQQRTQMIVAGKLALAKVEAMKIRESFKTTNKGA
jgi:ATP-dependent protease ClpP protease subunit